MFSALLPFAPLAFRLISGLLPANVSNVLTTAIDTVKQGVAIATPVLNILGNATAQDARGEQINDISLTEMSAAIESMKVAAYDAALAKAKEV